MKETPMQQAYNDGRYIRSFFKAIAKSKRSHAMRPGEATLKQWKMEQAEREGVTIGVVETRLSRGKYPNLKLRRVNQRVIFVQTEAE